jgi:branched-chain amino acid transport system substrate-binding protein
VCEPAKNHSRVLKGSRAHGRICMNKRQAIYAACAVLASFAPGAAQAQSEFKVGFVLSQIGPLAELAKTYLDGAEVGVAMVNDTGGIGGLKVRLIACDAQGQEPQAVICAKKLINDDKVNLMIGATGTPQTMAIIPTVESAGVPLFGMGAGRVIWEPVKKWVFKSFPSNDDQIPAELNYAKKKGWNRVALLTDNTSFGKDTVEMTREVVKKNGMELVAEESYAPSDTDITAQVTRVRAANPDVVLNLAGTIPLGILVAKKATQLGMKTPLVQGMNFVVENYPSMVPQAIDQSYFAGSKMMVDLPPSDPLYANITVFRKKYAAMRGASAKPNGNTITVPDILLMVQKVTQGMGAKVLDPEALRSAIEGARDIPELQGIWNLSPTNHGNSFAAGTVVLTNVKGEWKLAQ